MADLLWLASERGHPDLPWFDLLTDVVALGARLLTLIVGIPTLKV